MKNAIYITIDTERDQPIIIGKPPEITPPGTPEEAKEMILIDINCVTEALCRLIDIAHQNNYGDLTNLVDNSIMTLHSMKTEILNPPLLNKEDEDEETDNKV
jgi:hypothetical protein